MVGTNLSLHRKPVWVTLATVLWVSAAFGTSAAEGGEKTRREFDLNALTSKWLISVGGSLSNMETSAAWSPAGLAGAVIILEDALGLDEEVNNIFLNAAYRFNRRHSIELSATDLDRNAARTIDAEIEWGDYVFRAFGRVSSELDTRIIRLKWKYDFSDSKRLNAGFSAGISTFDLGLKLEGEARLEDDDGGEWVEGVVEGTNVLAPVPVIGFYLDYALSPRWVIRFNTEAIDLNLGSSSGRVLQTEFKFEYSFNELFGLGFGIGGIDLEYRTETGDELFGVDYSIESASAYLSFAF